MCVQLRPVIKDDSMLQAVFKVCLKYTSTQKWCQKSGIVINSADLQMRHQKLFTLARHFSVGHFS